MTQEPSKKVWGPWIPWGNRYPPDGLNDHRFQAVYINEMGQVMNDAISGNDRRTLHHIWWTDSRPDVVTLAYRIENT